MVFALFGALLAFAIFYYLFTQITWGQVVGIWRDIDGRWVAAFVVLALLLQFVRTWRYRGVLLAMGERTGWARLFMTVLIRGVCVDMLPARLGELVYIYILRTRLGVNLGAATASFALVFLFDILALAPLMVLALSLVVVGADVEWSSPLLMAISAGLFVVAALLISSLPLLVRTTFLLSGWALPRGGRLRHWVRRLLASTHRQIHRAKAHGVYTRVFLQSLLVRILKYTALYALLLAMVLPQGYTIAEWPLHKVFLGLTAAEMAASLPVSGVLGFGAYQGAWTLVFVLLGFPVEMAQITSVAHHVFTQVYGYLMGLFALVGLMWLRPVSGRPWSADRHVIERSRPATS